MGIKDILFEIGKSLVIFIFSVIFILLCVWFGLGLLKIAGVT